MNNLKIAIQKSGRLLDNSLQILKECGISIDNGQNQLKASASNFPLEILYLRNSDIPNYVEDGVADLGIIGENLVFESEKNIEVVQKLGFSKCRLSIAVPKSRQAEYIGPEWLHQKRVATSYPNSLRAFLEKHQVSAEIHKISGSVEIAPNIGLADAICDLVSSGNTLFMNGLSEADTVLKSEAVLVKNLRLDSHKLELLDKILFRLKSVLIAKQNRYILMNVPNNRVAEVTKILPGMRSPTVLPLADEGWSSVHTVIKEYKFWDIIDDLKEKGAEGILVVPIQKMIL